MTPETGEMHFWVERRYRHFGLHLAGNLRIWSQEAGQIISKFHIADNLTLLEAQEGDWSEPFLRMNQEQAQQLLDELWTCGLRPRDIGTAGHLAATNKHLEDMRTLVFDKWMEIKKP